MASQRNAQKLKIVYLVRDLRPGGVPSFAGPILRKLSKMGHQVMIYNLGLVDEVADIVRDLPIISGGRPDGDGYRGHATSFRRWKNFVAQEKPDVLQSHVGLPDIHAAFTRLPQGVKIRAALAPRLFPAQPLFGYLFENCVSP